MNTEEKAKAYDEALGRAKSLFGNCPIGSERAKICSIIFPQLAESEDERIRKWILEKVQGYASSGIPCSDEIKMADKAIDYLEKQKECLADNSKTSASDNERIREELIGALMWQRDCLDAKGPHDNNLILPGFTMEVGDILEWLEKQKEQKPLTAEETELNSIAFLEQMGYTCIPPGKEQKLTESRKRNKPKESWLSKAKYEIEHADELLIQKQEELREIRELKNQEQKPIKMEVYEVGKGTTICGQDYKCKKDYKEGNCWYIKDAIYHCGRDGYLTDQNGISWSCTPEWFNEYIQSNTEWAEEEKTRFVSGQFLQCKLSFDEFKEGEHYWLEYIGNDMYVGRSDNILNQKFHITPRQLYTLFSQQLEEKQKEQKPAEWSEEDSRIIGTLSSIIFDYAFHIDALDGNHDLTGEYAELDNWLGTLPERFNLQPKEEWSEVELEFRGEKIKVKRPFFRDDKGRGYSTTEQDEEVAWNALRAWCEKKGISLYDLYPKVEWGEEDEEIFNNIIEKAKSGHWIEVNEITWLITRFKSLRPSWKPSEEQMVELNKVRTLNPGLDALYQQLKNM